MFVNAELFARKRALLMHVSKFRKPNRAEQKEGEFNTHKHWYLQISKIDTFPISEDEIKEKYIIKATK